MTDLERAAVAFVRAEQEVRWISARVPFDPTMHRLKVSQRQRCYHRLVGEVEARREDARKPPWPLPGQLTVEEAIEEATEEVQA